MKYFYNSLHDENQAMFPAKEIWGKRFFFFFCLGDHMGEDPNH